MSEQRSSKKGGLGKGLNSLLGLDNQIEIETTREKKPQTEVTNLVEIEVSRIKPNPRQPRKIFNEDELVALSKSLKEDGVVQPLIVAKEEGGSYTLIAGERRWRASQMAGFSKVPALVKSVTPDEMLRIAIIENVQRSNLNVIEEAEAYAALIKDFGLTQEECAKKIGKDRVTVTNILRILTLPQEVQDNLMANQLSMGHGRALLSLSEKSLILRAQDIILTKKLSVRQTEQLVKKIKNNTEKETVENEDPDLEYLAESLRSHLRTKVKLSGNGSRGKIEISYFSAAELERLLASIGGTHFE